MLSGSFADYFFYYYMCSFISCNLKIKIDIYPVQKLFVSVIFISYIRPVILSTCDHPWFF